MYKPIILIDLREEGKDKGGMKEGEKVVGGTINQSIALFQSLPTKIGKTTVVSSLRNLFSP